MVGVDRASYARLSGLVRHSSPLDEFSCAKRHQGLGKFGTRVDWNGSPSADDSEWAAGRLRESREFQIFTRPCPRSARKIC